MNRFHLVLAACVLGCNTQAYAGDLSQVGALSPSDFHRLSEDLGAVAAYRGVAPATPLGLTGFDIGLGFAATRLQNRGVLDAAGAGSLTTVYTPTLQIQKGLPGGFDVGASLGRANVINMSLFGAEVRYALLDDTLTTPALGLRLSGSRATGVSQLALSTYAFDVMLSKKLVVVTPFAGIGAVRVSSNGSGKASFSKTRAFAGLGLNVSLINVAVEAEAQGGVNTFSAKAGLRF